MSECEPGRHRWDATGRYTSIGQLYRCKVCGKTEIEP